MICFLSKRTLTSMDSTSIQSSSPPLSMSTILVLLYSAFIAFSICSHAADQDNILLNCGSSHTILSQDRREFIGDHTSKFTSSTSSESAASEPFLYPESLYRTARLFTAKSTYTVPITDISQRHFLRFHFYPASYNTHKLTDANFSVTYGPYVFLHNFTLATLKQPHVIEFCIPVTKRKQLDVIFTPEATNPKSYAFINAMEIISIPDRLFGNPAHFQSFLYNITVNTALQTLYRLNVGGNTLSLADDKYARSWVDDSKFIFGAAFGVAAVVNSTEIQQADDFAPNSVYGTFRSMGPDPVINVNFNLSWVFSNIDANFSYLVRLHFCELQFNKINQRVFDIYINNQTVEEAFDVIEKASGPNIPIYRDYIIYVPADESATADLWVELHPNIKLHPQYYDAILNGLEIFKLNDSSGNLAGLNPVVTDDPAENSANGPLNTSNSTNNKRKGYMTGIVFGSFAAAVTLLCLMILYFVLRRKRKNSNGSRYNPFTAVGSHAGGTTASTMNSESSAFTESYSYGSTPLTAVRSTPAAGIFCRHFKFSEIQDATNNFDDSLLLGVGGFGKVYRGEISGGLGIAVKRAKQQSLQGSQEFRNEIDLLSRLRHKNLVSLIGYCDEMSEMCLVYDFVPNGTLQEHLHGRTILSWKQRLEICIGAAKGLDYLHSGALQTVIHRDVNSSNILLDENLSAKVSDFGFSKVMDTFDQSHVTTAVKGTYGYMDPQYLYRMALTKKSDVYSFGVVLFEVLCAKSAVMSTQSGEKMNLSDCVLQHLRDGALEHMIDPNLIGDITSDSLQIFTEVGEKCLAEEGEERPSMADVVWHLEFALQLHETATCPGGTIRPV